MSKGKSIFLNITIFVLALIIYVGFTAINAFFLFTLDRVRGSIQQFVAMVLTGVSIYFVFKLILRNYARFELKFDAALIVAVLVASALKIVVSPFSMGLISLWLVAFYLMVRKY